MTKFIGGLVVGLLIGLAAAVTAQHTTTGSRTGATPSGNPLIGTTDSTVEFAPPTSFVFFGKGPQELLRIGTDGTVTYQGRVLGTDKDIWDALRATFDPGRVCQEWEEDLSWGRP